MPNPSWYPLSRHSDRRWFCQVIVFVVAVAAALLTSTGALFAQQAPVHLNPIIEKLAEGKQVFGVSTADLSLDNARALSRSPIDYVHVDMEHSPMNFEALRIFTLGMIDKQTILKKGNAQPNVALIARFAPYGREGSEWIVKQALDIGLMGVVFNGIDDKEQATMAVRNMRYPRKKGSPLSEPGGLRGYAPTNAVWLWGIPPAEYERRADVWPLNPNGDLLAIMMIETAEGLQNVDDIASVPGVGALFVGTGGDMHQYLGVTTDSPELEAAFQKILKACLAHNVACWKTVTTAEMPKRVKEGWKILGVGAAGSGGGLNADNDAALRAGRAAVAK